MITMILGYVLALIIGLSLGLLGGGGSILTVPILVYVLNMDAKVSIALSLAIVAITSLFGVIGHYKNNNVDFKLVSIFAPFAMLGTFIGAKLSSFFTSSAQLILFAIIMLLASFFMLKNTKKSSNSQTSSPIIKNHFFNGLIIALEGSTVGILTGIVGVGGGFLIVPALVLLGGVDMKKAVGTSLFIITLKSISGFLGYIDLVKIDYTFLVQFSFFSVVGIFIGSYLTKFIEQEKLKKSFGIFLVIMAVFILYKNKHSFKNSSKNTQAIHQENRYQNHVYFSQ